MSQQPRQSIPFDHMRRRAEFAATAKGVRVRRDAFGLQARARSDTGGPRFGLTLTKKTAGRAVDRNRMRRRLREALRLGAALSGAAGHDYVIVGREPLLSVPFGELQASLGSALAEVRRKLERRRAEPDRGAKETGA